MPAMLKNSYVVAGAVLLIVVVWLLSGLVTGGKAPDAAVQPNEASPVMTVRVRELALEPYVRDIVISGRSEAFRTVAVRARTDGAVAEVAEEKGERVKTGDVICRLAVDDRQANLDEARALEAQRALEHRAARELADKGHRSETEVAAARARLDAAIAMVERHEVELSHTVIRAPFDGIIDQRSAELGDYLMKGDSCAHVLDDDPFLMVGEISERQVGLIAVGDAGSARLADGTYISGRIRYVAEAASPETRTYRMELEVPGGEHRLRDGMTAEIRIPVAEVPAHRLSRANLVLNDDGEVGVRLVEDGIVRFHAVRILGDDNAGVWVEGLPDLALLITVGQAFVADGQRVQISRENSSGGDPEGSGT